MRKNAVGLLLVFLITLTTFYLAGQEISRSTGLSQSQVQPSLNLQELYWSKLRQHTVTVSNNYSGFCTAVIISQERIAGTNVWRYTALSANHLIHPEQIATDNSDYNATVYLDNGTILNDTDWVRILKRHEDFDVLSFRFASTTNLNLSNLVIAPLQSTDSLISIGNPYNTGIKPSYCHVLRLTQEALNSGPTAQNFFEFSGNILPGCSGGPVFNQQGQLVGITSSRLMVSGTIVTLIGYASHLIQIKGLVN